MFLITTLLKFYAMFRKTRRLVMDLGYLVILLLISFILYSNSAFFNSFTISNLKIGSLILLISSLFTLRYAFSILSFFFGSYRRLNSVIKFIIMASVLVLALYFFLNQGKVLNSAEESMHMIDLDRFNPVMNNNVINSTG
jgi:hypothetical protein